MFDILVSISCFDQISGKRKSQNRVRGYLISRFCGLEILADTKFCENREI